MNPRYIINFPTKRHWRDPSRIEDIESGLAALVEEIQRQSIRSIATPAIGAGLGGLSWIKARGLIEKTMTKLDGTKILSWNRTELGIHAKKVSISGVQTFQSDGHKPFN